MKLRTLSAYVSTLGGGYFCCRYLTHSDYLAKLGKKIMDQLGDEGGGMRVKVNEAYGNIHKGKFGKAEGILREVERWAGREGDGELGDIVKAAKKFMGDVRRVGERGGRGGTEDELYRIRIVREG